jgi:lipopolysaccharide/colanic/teichoic acid biosynthesis glycosyltransferase
MSTATRTAVRAGSQRLLDVGLVVVLLPLVLPMLALAILAIALDSRGPVVLRQTRIGRNGQPFQLYKLRTLRVDRPRDREEQLLRAFVRGENIAGRNGQQKPFDESAVTRVGRVLRRTSIDELPQVFNVLLGQMSLVGPRPHLLWEVEEYEPWHYERLRVRLGITGQAQLSGRSTATFDQIVRADIAYVRTRTLAGDLRILLRTLLWVAIGRGAG